MTYPSNPKITLVGSGLVGSLLALFLARRGISVEILERRPDMRREAISAGRSINLAISARGLYALSRVGLEEEILTHAVPMRGRMMHAQSRELTFQRYGKDDSQCINSISRGTLNKILMTRAEATGKVSIRFNERVVGYDLASRTLHLRNEKSGTASSLMSEIVIGTDGSASAIRDSLEQAGLCNTTEEKLAHGYKELVIPPSSLKEAGSEFQMEKNALHIWPRGSYMLIALPNADGSFTCTLFLPFEGPLSFEAFRTENDVLAFFKNQFPDSVPLVANLTRDFFEHPTGSMITVKSTPWFHQGQVLLLGDAAHGIVPFFGQGMNAGFEDCVALDELLESTQDWKTLFSELYRRRKENTDAIADMAVENFVEMRDKVANPRFLLEKKVEQILHREFPEDYVSRYSLVSFSRVPYAKAYQTGVIQSRILAQLCEGLNDAEQVDLALAKTLISKHLTPFFKGAQNGSGTT